MSSLVKRTCTPALLPPACCDVRPGNTAHRRRAEALEDVLDRFAEAVPVGEQQHDSRDSPRHARHGEQGTAQVVAHGRVSLL